MHGVGHYANTGDFIISSMIIPAYNGFTHESPGDYGTQFLVAASLAYGFKLPALQQAPAYYAGISQCVLCRAERSR